MRPLFNTTPNQLSILRIILTPLFVWAFFSKGLEWKEISLVLFVIASITDWYDGHVARKYGMTSLWGRFLDPLADKILVLTVFVVFALTGYVALWMVIVIVIRDVLVTGLRWYAMYKKRPIRTSYTAKAKTTAQMIVIYVILLYAILKQISFERPALWAIQTVRFFEKYWVIDILMWIVVLLTVLTGIQYLIVNKMQVKGIFNDLFHSAKVSDA